MTRNGAIKDKPGRDIMLNKKQVFKGLSSLYPHFGECGENLDVN
jgi:hypothetical protein